MRSVVPALLNPFIHHDLRDCDCIISCTNDDDDDADGDDTQVCWPMCKRSVGSSASYVTTIFWNQAATHRECKASLDKYRRDMCGVSAHCGSWMAPEVYLYVNVSSSESSLVGVVRGKDLCPRTTRLSYDMCAISRHIGLASVRHAIPLPTIDFL